MSLLLTIHAGPASAYDPTNHVACHYSTPTLKWKNATTRVGYSGPAQEAAKAWTATATPISWTVVTTGANLTVTDGVYADDNLVGVTQYGSQGSCSGGFYSVAPVTSFNRGFLDSRSAAARKAAMVHEIGHALGLGHSQYSNCTAILWGDFATIFTACGLTTPQSDDVAGINLLY